VDLIYKQVASECIVKTCACYSKHIPAPDLCSFALKLAINSLKKIIESPCGTQQSNDYYFGIQLVISLVKSRAWLSSNNSIMVMPAKGFPWVEDLLRLHALVRNVHGESVPGLALISHATLQTIASLFQILVETGDSRLDSVKERVASYLVP